MRWRGVGSLFAILAASTVVVSVPSEAEDDPRAAVVSDVGFEDLHLPRVVNAPGTWSSDVRPRGPWAAVGLSTRTRPRGVTGSQESLEPFAVSAVDGRSGWVVLPGVGRNPFVGVALSPNGQYLAWPLPATRRKQTWPGWLRGWAVMDTITGKVSRLADPASSRVRETVADLTFSGDSRYLLTNYELPGAPPTRGHQFVAWDVTDGTSTVLEPPGDYWLPSVGSAPTGVVWARKRALYRADPATGTRRTYPMPVWTETASWAPDDSAFAAIGAPQGIKHDRQLYAGTSMTTARAVPLDVDGPLGQILGWVDDRHVVIGHYRRSVDVVDVATGESVRIAMAGYGEILNSPLLAADLWRNPLAEPVAPHGISDPRRPWRRGGAGVLAFLAVVAAIGWLRRPRLG